MHDLVDTHVLITGGAAGIGLCIAQQCLRQGARVSLLDINDSTAAVEQLHKATGDVHVASFRADVSQYAQVCSAFRDARAAHGPVDLVVANAGIAGQGELFVDEDLELHHQILSVDYLGAMHTARAALPDMLARQSGHILFVGSLMAMYGAFGGSSYCAAKAAVRALADSLRLELLGTGVGVSISLPGLVDTPLAHRGSTNPRSPQLAKDMLAEIKASAAPPSQVAALAIDAVLTGRYIARGPNFGLDLATASGATIHPRVLPVFVELFLAPVILLMPWVFGRSLSRRIVAWRRAQARTKSD